MKSTEVYRVIRKIVAPWCKEQGFRRTSGGMLGWHRPEKDEHLLFWFQCSQQGWDPYAGSRFVVEFQVSDTPQIGIGCHRHRLPHFLNKTELEQMRAIQNSVIARLPPPARDYFILALDPHIVESYLAEFQPAREPLTAQDDIWLCYHQPDDVRRWAEFVLSVLPKAVEQAIAE